MMLTLSLLNPSCSHHPLTLPLRGLADSENPPIDTALPLKNEDASRVKQEMPQKPEHLIRQGLIQGIMLVDVPGAPPFIPQCLKKTLQMTAHLK